MFLRRRLSNLEKRLARRFPVTGRVHDMTDWELCVLLAQGMRVTPMEVAGMNDEQLRTFLESNEAASHLVNSDPPQSRVQRD